MNGWYSASRPRPLTRRGAKSTRAADDTNPTVSDSRLSFQLIQERALVAVKIRLLRMGKIRNPQYRIVIADARTKRDGRAIEFVGLYHPKEDPSRIEVNSERVQHWLSVGAQPSEAVRAILSKTGDWQKYKGLPPPTEPLKVAPERADRTAVYEAESKAAAGLAEAAKPARKAEPKRAEPRKAEPKASAETTPAAAPAAPAPAPAEAAPAEAGPAEAAPAAATTEETGDAGPGAEG
jgi:small subunit ribosomal protein S16